MEHIPGQVRTRRTRVVRLALFLIDATALQTATWLANLLLFGGSSSPDGFESASAGSIDYVRVSLGITVLWLTCLWFERLYDLDRLFWGAGEFSRILKAVCIGLVAFILVAYIAAMPRVSRAWLLLVSGLSIALLSAGRLLVRWVLRRLRENGRLLRPTLILGDPEEAAILQRRVTKDKSLGYVIVGAEDSGTIRSMSESCALPRPVTADDVVDVVAQQEIETVIATSSAFDHRELSGIVERLRTLPVELHISPALFGVLPSRVFVREVAGIPLVTVKGVSLSKGNLATKRLFDVMVAGSIVIVGMPAWLVLIALIRLTSPGSAFYRQERMGLDGQPFGMMKFRSMYTDADQRLAQLKADNEASGPLFKMKEDPRVTPLGRWMRKLSIDEFPQLINVLKGEMSLVGPRPPLPCEFEDYSEQHCRRLSVPPGMTGLWQVSGRSDLDFDEMVELDLFYIENWSVSWDLALLARTIPAVLSAKGAY